MIERVLGDLINQLPILAAMAMIGMLLYGLGGLIATDQKNAFELRTACIDAGMQVLQGGCVR
jgi:hypothetical protein